MNLERIINTDIEFIDGDRGQNYPSKSDFFENGYCVFLNTGNITRNGFDFSKLDFITEEKDKSLRKGKVKSDDIILTTRGTVGNVALVTETIKYANMRINSGMVIIRSKKDFTPLFLNTFFRSELFKKQALTNGSGSAQPQLPISALKNISIPKLDKKTQDKIASVLSTLDEKIALNNQINVTLEQMAKTLYDYWFVQFDFPDDNGKPYKSSGGEMVYNETLKRDIPKGWDITSLDEFAKVKKGILITEKTANTQGKIKVVSAGVDYSYFHDKSNYPENTITISASGANAGFINFWREPIFACDCTTVIADSIGKTLYVLNFLRQVQSFIYQQARGSAQPHVYPKDLEVLNLVKPCENLLKSFDEKVKDLNEKISVNLKENQQLVELRDWLLPMLMNGQVTVQ